MITLKKAGSAGFFLLGIVPALSLAESATSLERALRTEPSATKVLQNYCRRLLPTIMIEAVQLPTLNKPPPARMREYLRLRRDDAVMVRHVALRCGPLVLSDAWNWYVPQRLTSAMNHQLLTTTIPFGRVVADLDFYRQALPGKTTALPPDILLRNAAILKRGADGMPFAIVVENYRAAGFSTMSKPFSRPASLTARHDGP